MIYFLYLMALCQICAGSTLGYDRHQYDCSHDGTYTSAERQNMLVLYPLDALGFVIIGPFSLMACIFIIAAFFKFPKSRRVPGDILLGMSVYDSISCEHLISSGAYFLIHGKSPKESSAFCQVNGGLSTFSFVGIFLYNLSFVLSPVIIFSDTLGKKQIYQQIMHICIFIISLGVMIIAYKQNLIHLQLSGLCGLSNPVRQDTFMKSGFVSILLLFIYIITSLVALNKFRKYVPSLQEIKQMRKKYLFIYQRFVFITTLLWTMGVILSIITNINCYLIHDQILNVTNTVCNMIDIITPIVQSYIRAQDPVIRKHIVRMLTFEKSQSINQMETSLQSLPTVVHEDSQSYLQSIQSRIKQTQIQTFLVGIMVIIKEHRKSKLKCEQSNINDILFSHTGKVCQKTLSITLQELAELNTAQDNQQQMFCEQVSTEKVTTVIGNQVVEEYYPQFKGISALNMRVTMYAPNVFKYFIDKDRQMFNIEESMDLILNKDNILGQGAPQGGKSGEFFFFTHDKKLILKTMQQSEVTALRKRMQLYGNYLYNHPDSLISKIYGVFTFVRIDDNMAQPIHILFMRNLSLGIPNQYIVRTFDMKGSEFDRQVIGKSKDQDLSKLTLKDLDFFKTEKKIYVKPQLSEVVVSSLFEDARFFQKARLIDYSLLVFKIDWGKYMADTGLSFKQTREKVTNPLYMMESIQEPGIYYQMAIIDYLQEWNVNKGAEQFTKKIINLNVSLDTSSQNPDIYADRFYKKLVLRIFIPDSVQKQETKDLQLSEA